jgi:hypothetical protein
MLIYTNIPICCNIEDLGSCTISYDEYIFTYDGVYKKYNKHFYEIDLCDDIQQACLDDEDFFIQKQEHFLNKHKIITTVPFKHYYVQKKTITHIIDDDLTFVKELDNDVFTNHYFITNNSDFSMFDKISSFLKNNVSQ